MNIILLGHNGQIGNRLKTVLPTLGHLNLPDIDITDQIALTDYIERLRPDIIINAAAYTDVDNAESNKQKAFSTNAIAPATMAKIAKNMNALLIHYSTDYVFDGKGVAPWTEDSSPSPINTYGLSKAEGDAAIMASGCPHLILRTSWIYGLHGNNFIKTILRLLLTKNELNIVCDQVGSPTSSDFIARSTIEAIKKAKDNQNLHGLYNICCSGETSWYDYAQFISNESSINLDCKINPVLSSEYKQMAQRPKNSKLNTTKWLTTFDTPFPYWKDEVKKHLPDIVKAL